MRGYLKPMTLRALQDGCMTGYAIASYIEDKTGKRPSYGSLYPLIEHLEQDKLITIKEDKKKKIICITSKGKGEAKKIEKTKEKLVEKIQEGIQIFSTMYGMKSGDMHIELLKRMKEGTFEIGIMPEIDEFKRILLEVLLNNPNPKQIQEIRKLVLENIKKIKQIEKLRDNQKNKRKK